jgi:hypothetical protein
VGGTVADRVLELFSPRLREHYRLQEGLDTLWRFAATGSDEDKKECVRLAALLSRQKRRDAKEGYDDEFFHMIRELLGEAKYGGGAGCTNAVDYASTCYLNYQGYRQGIEPADDSFPSDYAYETSRVLYQFSRTVYDFASENEPPPERAAFAALRLDVSVVPLPRSVLQTAKMLPPEAERQYFQATYS